MLQRLVRNLIRAITGTFFRRIDVVGAENVPDTGPVIFAGNHPNALMDGWLLTARCGRWPLHFMANAKLWDYPMMAPLLNAGGAVPVYRREDHGDDADNSRAFDRLYKVLEAGDCMGVFPEGVSHVESQLTRLKTGAARIALSVARRGKVVVRIVPCGLNYIHRHRFRSQVLIEFGEAIEIDDQWLRDYDNDEQQTVRALTERLASALASVTLNAPDWNTLRFVQAARRLYKPATADLSPSEYVELNRRFIERYVASRDDPDLQAFRADVEDYQARLEMLDLKDYQLRQPVSLSRLFRKIMVRGLTIIAWLPLAIPGALLHLPVGWIAAVVGERFSYEMDDIATLKVLATISLLPLLYLGIGILVGVNFGWWWALAAIGVLSLSFFTSVRLLEVEAGLLNSVLSLFRIARLGEDVEDLRETRRELVDRIRTLVDRLADPDVPRMFTQGDFSQTASEDDS